MSTVYEVNGSELIKLAAERLKDKMKVPEYVSFVKSGVSRERVPQSPDFWYMRSASILRQVYLNGPVGVERLRSKYGSKKQHVVHHMHTEKAGGSIIRDALQALEEQGFVKKSKTGRTITPKGKSFLDKISSEMSKK